jgi:hypothetical protein
MIVELGRDRQDIRAGEFVASPLSSGSRVVLNRIQI